MELLEDALQLLRRYSGTGISDGNREVAVRGGRRNAHFASVGELDCVADQVEEHLRETLLISQADGQTFCNFRPACDLELTAFLLDLAEEARIINRQCRLRREHLQQVILGLQYGGGGAEL